MAGIQSLMQAPGQAQQAPLPGMMPSQQGTQQGLRAFIPDLRKMNLQQLGSMLVSGQKEVPANLIIAAMTEQQQAAEAKAAVERQMAMAQNAAAPTGTIAQQVVQRAMQGSAQGYAGGGAVAFQTAGAVPPGLLNPDVDEDGLPRGKDEREQIIDYNERLKSAYQRSAKAQATQAQAAAATAPRPAYPEEAKRQLEQFYRFGPRGSSGITADAATPTAASVPMSMQDTRGGTPEMAALAQMLGSGAAPAPSASAAPGGQRQATVSGEQGQAVSAPTVKLPDLPPERVAQVGRDITQSEKLAADQAALVERLSKPSPEVLAARENLQRIMGSAYDPQKKTLEEAKDLFARGIGGNAEALGRMAAAMGGAKHVGQGLAAAAGAGSQFVGEQRKRVEDLQDKYNSLKSQLDITMAQAQYADVVGDDKLKRDALTKAEEIKKNLFDTQRSIRKESFGEQVQQAQGIASLQKAQADLIQAGKPDAATAMLRAYAKNPELVTKFFTAQTEGKAKNPFDMINDNAQRLYSDWLKSTGGMTATEGQRAAMWQQIFDQQIAAAARFGVKVPEAGAAPAKGTKDDPIKLG